MNNYLHLRHAVDIIKIKNAAERVRLSHGPKGQNLLNPDLVANNPNARAHPGTIYGNRPRTGPGGRSLAEIQDALEVIRRDLSGHEVILKVGGREVITNQYEEMKRASAVVTDHYRDMLDMQVVEGLVTRELADQLKNQYKYYNPVKYIEGTLINIHNLHVDGTKAMLKGVGENDLRLLAEQGIDADLVRPLEHLANVTMRTYLMVYRNRAMKSLIPTLLLDPRSALLVVS